MGDKLLLKLNIYGKPIANKYCEGKVKRTLKRVGLLFKGSKTF